MIQTQVRTPIFIYLILYQINLSIFNGVNTRAFLMKPLLPLENVISSFHTRLSIALRWRTNQKLLDIQQYVGIQMRLLIYTTSRFIWEWLAIHIHEMLLSSSFLRIQTYKQSQQEKKYWPWNGITPVWLPINATICRYICEILYFEWFAGTSMFFVVPLWSIAWWKYSGFGACWYVFSNFEWRRLFRLYSSSFAY